MVDGEKERKSVNMSMFAFLAADGRPAQSGIVNQRVLSHEEAERAAHLREGEDDGRDGRGRTRGRPATRSDSAVSGPQPQSAPCHGGTFGRVIAWRQGLEAKFA